ncbi:MULTISPECIES: flagellar hook-basal body protein [unclassified Campylobacter]|uniref:flagellar hook-basal body protein n=1 Tax=unclassified Campylobacter TaxID=2593542 RepID=UPI001237F72A|nr:MULTISPECIES: flagellar hook-basal body protein [unclassified Campylobacter]KAA6225949.1 flagellar hook-basal body protein [Campylobacter sp. LR286c]KAA6228163.1 flagellar hook-basal body protein [Campylobacter sp. LR185c]KAA6228816.1 flagellar hook-basal body protein [Campylobacter sp. LR196d]KAA6231213.1 flagellar hook-basal body protein [Campylobacter sp. LR291e]KAA6234374.1 flagellar hook-basal body protein [Campylobacter sp. LR264d]
MQNGFYQATGAMVTQFNRLDVITNNLANVNTSGYKRDDVVIADFKRIFRETQDVLPIENHTRDAARFANTTIDRVPQVSQEYTDFSTGAIKATNNRLDLAITRDDAFYLVQTKNGEVRLSKDGNFQLDSDGFLVNKQGYKVLSNAYFDNPEDASISIGVEANDVSIDKDGNISVDGIDNSTLYIAQVDDIRNLKKEGDNVYRLDDLTKMRELPNSNCVRQGYSQGSNVNPVIEMVGLIEAQRMVEMYQKVMTAHMDDLNQDAIDKLASVS